MTAPRVSVQICTHNRAAMVARCLDSLGGQTAPAGSFDVVVVDDGSSDGTEEQLSSRRDPFPCRVLRVPHGGLAQARNVGIRAAVGSVVLFIDDDEVAEPALVEQHWRAHERHPGSVVLGWVHHVESYDEPVRRTYRLADFSTSFFWTSNASVRRDDLLAAGLFDEDFTEYGWEDLELGERLRRLGLARRYVHGAVVRHIKRRWVSADVPALLRRAEASGRMAVLFVRKQPTWRSRLATGLSPWRMAINRGLEPLEPWCERRIARSGGRPLAGVTWMAAYVRQRVAYYRAARQVLRDGAPV